MSAVVPVGGTDKARHDAHVPRQAAYRQLLDNREDLKNPPLLIVSDIERIEIHTNFTGLKPVVETITLDEMATDPATCCTAYAARIQVARFGRRGTRIVHAQTRARNRLHTHLVILLPGYGRTVAQLVSGRQLEAIERALTGSTGVRAELARALLTEVRDLGRRAAELERSIAALVAGHPVLGLPGVGVLTAARLVAEVGDVARFRSPAAFAMLAGVAPIPASSGETQRMRLNRGGNRRLNRALYTIALSPGLAA